MNRLSQFAGLLALVLVIWLVATYSRKPVQKTVSPATSAVSTKARPPTPLPTSGRADDEAKPGMTATGEEMPATEESWAAELRELKALAEVDPAAALAQVALMPDKHERKTAAQAVCLLLAPVDAAQAMTAAWGLDLGRFADESAENETLESLAKQWAKVDPVQAFAWARTLPADEEWRRDRVLKGIASVLAQVDPVEAAHLVVEDMSPDSSVQIEATMEVLRQWSAREFAGAVAWVALFPEGPVRERGIDELAMTAPSGPPAEPKPN